MESTPGKSPTDNYQFEATFRQVTSNMYDRIATPALHGDYGPDSELAEKTFAPANPNDKKNEHAIEEAYSDQIEEARDAYLQLASYDRSLGCDPAVSLILLPPRALLEVESTLRDQFLEDYAGARVIDEGQLIVGVTRRWTLAVVQGDLRGGQERPPEPPAHLGHMKILTPLGYAGMGGSIDRQVASRERHCTELEAVVDGEHITAYGSYVHRGPQSHRGHKIRVGERDPVLEGELGPARIIISTQQPDARSKSQFQFLAHPKPMPVRRRLMYWAGMDS